MKTVCLYIFELLNPTYVQLCYLYVITDRSCHQRPVAGAAPLYKTVTLAHHPPADLLVYYMLWHEAVSCGIPGPHLYHCNKVCRLKQDK